MKCLVGPPNRTRPKRRQSIYIKLYVCLSVCVCLSWVTLWKKKIRKKKIRKILLINLPNYLTTTTRGGGGGGGGGGGCLSEVRKQEAPKHWVVARIRERSN